MRHGSTTFVSVACLVLVAGCSGGSIPLSDVPAKQAHASCEALARCFGPATVALYGDSNCESLFTQQFTNQSIATLQAEVTAGKTIYHGDLAQACLDAIAAVDCNQLSQVQLLPECRAAIEGTVAVGGACTVDIDCAGDAYCAFAGACMGTCTARVGAGHACTGSASCTLGLVCDRTNVCSAPATAGMTCQGPTGPDCAPGLSCVGASAMVPGTCMSLPAQFTAAMGASCNLMSGPYCMAGLSCAAQSATTFVCEGPVGAGAACKVALPDECPSGQYCMTASPTTLTGTCASLPGEGQPCRTVLGGSSLGDQCLGDLACVGAGASSPGTCMARLANGGACTDAAQCWGGACNSGLCAASSGCTVVGP